MYLCLAFGFQGRYRLLENGRSRLDEQRERAYNAIRTAHGEFERELSPHWRGVIEQRNPLIRYVPLWVVAAVAATLLLIAYSLFNWLLNNASDPVLAELSGHARPDRGDGSARRRRGASARSQAAAAQCRSDSGVAGFTHFPGSPNSSGPGQGDRGSRQNHRADSRRRAVRLRQAEVKTHGVALAVAQIGKELNTVEGRVLVTGHSDNVPIRTLQFPSNWHLSKARADSVVQVLMIGSSQSQSLYWRRPRRHRAGRRQRYAAESGAQPARRHHPAGAGYRVRAMKKILGFFKPLVYRDPRFAGRRCADLVSRTVDLGRRTQPPCYRFRPHCT
jgi:type VI secretion system protein ImpK